ncbi:MULTISPECIES: hypothetical protein [Aeromonas]|jgi:hypothetical protein|uniref:Uncharacterized protein n=1 Tax=Aeromonas encheleia TaxID=73010 RepID=A0AAE9MCS7_9GAMM|nr:MULTISPECIES: hypothetical protein [Aeromonas]MBV7438974.1 hypothetical protein [Aeromonas sp. sif2416]USV56025.1 hypothetical protein NHF51_11670 [Aeromonas encheleia]
MKNELNVSFGIFYVSAYLLVMLLGVGCYLWYDELIFLLGFGFFGCFIAARIAMGAVLASLSVQVAWLIAFLSTTLINSLLMGLVALVIYLSHQAVSEEISDNISGLLVAFQLLSAGFIFGGLKLHNYQLSSS